MKKKTRNILVVSSVIIGLIILLAIFGKLPFATTYSSNEILYPLYSSVCCESTEQWVSVLSQPTSTFRTYTCPTSTTECKIFNPTINCAWYQDEIWQIKINKANSQIIEYHNTVYPFNNEIPGTGQTFNPGESITYAGACWNIVSIQDPLMLLPQLSSLPQPVSSTMNIEYKDSKLWYYGALEGKTDIPNSNGCYLDIQGINNNNGEDVVYNSPKSGYEDEAQASKNLVSSIWNVQTGISKSNSFLKPSFNGMQLTPGSGQSCYQTIDKWIQLPELLNKNPKGQYQGKDVICSPNKGLIALNTMQVEGGSSFLVPISSLSLPSDFCCSDQECIQKHGVGWACKQNDYSCYQGAGSCYSDLNCQPQGGILQDKNCYMTQEGKFFTWDSKCVSGICSSATQKEVKCCDSYCNKQGLICDYTVGCRTIIPPTQPCPPMKCCAKENAFGFIESSCNEDLVCCDVTGGVGSCKTTCQGGKDEPCASCWNWLKDKFGIDQECKTGFIQKIKDALFCPFYFLKLALILVASIFALFFGKQFSEKMFKRQPEWLYWILGVIFAGLVIVLGYIFLTWYFVIPLVIIMFIAGIIINAIPGGRYLRNKFR